MITSPTLGGPKRSTSQPSMTLPAPLRNRCILVASSPHNGPNECHHVMLAAHHTPLLYRVSTNIVSYDRPDRRAAAFASARRNTGTNGDNITIPASTKVAASNALIPPGLAAGPAANGA
jgi:hypothetical protein